MTEAEWLMCENPSEMLSALRPELLHGRVLLTQRKASLFSTAAARIYRERFTLGGVDLLDAAEAYADRTPHPADLSLLRARLDQVVRFESRSVLNAIRTLFDDRASPEAVVAATLTGVYSNTPLSTSSLVLAVWCLFGNPFRPVSLEPAWVTSTVIALARGIYDGRAFDRTPILADALQDAGCEHPDILNHLRGDGPHVRGCWVVDLLLGKV